MLMLISTSTIVNANAYMIFNVPIFFDSPLDITNDSMSIAASLGLQLAEDVEAGLIKLNSDEALGVGKGMAGE
jgi:hypothetical protein